MFRLCSFMNFYNFPLGVFQQFFIHGEEPQFLAEEKYAHFRWRLAVGLLVEERINSQLQPLLITEG